MQVSDGPRVGEVKALRRIAFLEKEPKKHRPGEVTGEDDADICEYDCSEYLVRTTTDDRQDFVLLNYLCVFAAV